MDSDPWVIPLTEAALCDDQRIGGKAAQLARLHRAGFRIAILRRSGKAENDLPLAFQDFGRHRL